MWDIGVDAHKKRCVLVAKDKQGNLLARKAFPHTPEGWRDALGLAPHGSRVAIECIGWYQPICDLVEEMGLEPVLVHAKDVHLIAKSRKKTDRRDAEILCDLLRTDFIPRAYIPTKQIRELRELTRHLDDVVKGIVSVKNTIHRLLERAWITPPPLSDLFGKKGREYLRSLDTISPAHRVVLHTCLYHLDALDQIRDSLEVEIAHATQEDTDVNLLLGLDGLSLIGAATLKAEIADATRFPNRKKIRSNFGMAPSVRDSADTERRGRITKQGPGVVRKILVQGAPHFINNNAKSKKKHDRISKTKGKGVARVAGGADLLDVAYQMLKAKAPYDYVRPHKLAEKRRRLVRQAGRQGAYLTLALPSEGICVS